MGGLPAWVRLSDNVQAPATKMCATVDASCGMIAGARAVRITCMCSQQIGAGQPLRPCTASC